ncbi:MAG: hypothetical protein AB3N18_13320 [Allomuricauda sp.]
MKSDFTAMLDGLVRELQKRNINVDFISSPEEGIEIGELKEGNIVLNKNSRDELSMIFTIAHLFGHYCQFKNYKKYKHLIETVEKPVPLKLDDDFKNQFWEYEREAFGIGKTLMSKAFSISSDFESKYQIFMITDFEHFWEYITTGKNQGVEAFNKRLRSNYSKKAPFKSTIKSIPIPHSTDDGNIETKVTVY